MKKSILIVSLGLVFMVACHKQDKARAKIEADAVSEEAVQKDQATPPDTLADSLQME